MPIVVPCPGCPIKLSAPDSAAGKRIRCPKCQAVVAVPALVTVEEVPIVEAKVVPRPRPKRAAARVEEDDEEAVPRDEPEEGGDRPRKRKRSAPRKRPRRRQASGVGIVLAVIGVVLIGAVVAGAVLLSRNETAPESATGTKPPFGEGAGAALGPLVPLLPEVPLSRTPPPAGWKQYDYPVSGIRAYFPNQPMTLRTTYGSDAPPGIKVPPTENAYTYTTRGPDGPGARAVITLEVHRFKTSIPGPMRSLVLGPTYRERGAGRALRWLGGEAMESVKGNSVTRTVVLDRMIIDAVIVNLEGPPTPQEQAGFFDNVELTR